jgi:hypothetical protein
VKTCVVCGIQKPLEEFDPHKSYCKDCRREKHRNKPKRSSDKEKLIQGRRIQRGYYRKTRKKLKEQIFIKLGDKCAICGFADPRALHIDHINNDGSKERRKFSTITYYRRVLADNGKRYQILCANCNWIKKSEQDKLRWGEIPE